MLNCSNDIFAVMQAYKASSQITVMRHKLRIRSSSPGSFSHTLFKSGSLPRALFLLCSPAVGYHLGRPSRPVGAASRQIQPPNVHRGEGLPPRDIATMLGYLNWFPQGTARAILPKPLAWLYGAIAFHSILCADPRKFENSLSSVSRPREAPGTLRSMFANASASQCGVPCV